MQILTAFPKEKIIQFNKISNIFAHFSNPTAENSVALVIEGADFSKNLTRAAELGVPIIVIAGLKSMGQDNLKEAREFGIPERCIIFKDQDSIVSADGHKYGESPKGINIKTFAEIAGYVIENRLFPELFIWEEPPRAVKQDHRTQEPKRQEFTPQPPHKSENKEPRKPQKHILNEDLDAFLSQAQVLAVLKSVPTINSAPVAKTLAEKLNGIHLEINNEPHSSQQYAPSKEKAIQESYAFSNGKSVSYGVSEFKWIVVEINPSILEVMGTVYEQAAKIIYVVENFNESEPALDMWIDGGYKLDAIIPDPINISSYKEKYGDKVFELDQFTNQLERR